MNKTNKDPLGPRTKVRAGWGMYELSDDDTRKRCSARELLCNWSEVLEERKNTKQASDK